MLSVIIAVILGVQFYFSDLAQQELAAQMEQLTQSVNLATDSYYHNVLQTLQASDSLHEISSDTIKTEMKWFQSGNEQSEVIIKISGKNNKTDTLSYNKFLKMTPRKFIRHGTGKDTRKLLEEEIEEHICNDRDVRGHVKITTDTDSTSAHLMKVWRFIHKEKPDSPSVLVENIDVDLPKKIKPIPDEFKILQDCTQTLYTIRVPDFSRPDGPRILQYHYSTARLDQVLVDARNRNILITLILFFIALAAFYIITHRFLKPIAGLKKSFDDVVNGDLNALVPSKTQDEIGELTRSFNHMVLELRKNREKELLLQRKERLASVGQLAAGIAHEIKNPLNAINLTISHLRDKFISEQDTSVQKYIKTIQNEIRRLDKLVNNFLNFVRSENLEKSVTDIHQLLSEVLELYQREIAANKIALQTDFTDDFKAVVDSERLKTVFMNITLNAIQAMQNKGKLTVKTDAAARKIILIDNGIGIPIKDLEHIFDLFYTTKSTGTGLGLPTAYKIIKEHGGDILINSEPGAGTTVEIYL